MTSAINRTRFSTSGPRNSFTSSRTRRSNLRLSVVLATLMIMSSIIVGPMARPSAASQAVAPPSGPITHGGLTPRTTASPIYTAGELFGGFNPVVLCFTCQAAAITGTAPPSESLNAGSGVDNLTGDFTTSQTLFDAPSIGGDLSFTLTYDAQLAQSEKTAGGSPGPLGWGWSSNLQTSITAQTTGSTTSQLLVNQGNDSQVLFTQSSTTTCPSGDQYSTARYTASNLFASAHNWCALANVQAQVADKQGTELAYEQQGGKKVDYFSWNGTLAQTGTAQTIANAGGSITPYYNVAPGSEVATGEPNNQACPTTAFSCTLFYSSDGRVVVEAMNVSGQVVEVIDPAGIAYSFSYDGSGNLSALTEYSNTSAPSAWNYVYDSSQLSPYSSDLVQIYDPDSGVAAPTTSSPGATHSVSMNYYSSGSDVGMVSVVEDGTGATTSYSYQSGCAQGQCLGATSSQQTTVTYPAQVPCPNCAAQSPVETVNFTAGVETTTTLGSTTNSASRETWAYSWTMGYGSSNSTETITFPHSLSGTAPTETVTLDAAGNVVTTVNPLGDTATSAYNDTGSANLPELMWSYPGSSTNGFSTPPYGSEVYTYDSYGNVSSTTDPVGNATSYSYYASSGLTCIESPPTVSSVPSSCAGSGIGGPGIAATGTTTYTYDAFGDVVNQTRDYGDGTTTATITSGYDVMGNVLWTIPPPGQTGVQSSANSFATLHTYSPADVQTSETKPGQSSSITTYDAAINAIQVQTPAASTVETTVFDGDNRPCYTLTGAAATGLTCSAAAQAGSSATTYVPGSMSIATSSDSNGATTSYYYGDLAYPSLPTEVVDPLGQMIHYSAYDDLGNTCVTGSVAPALGTLGQCAVVAGDVSKSYNALSNETAVTDPSGNVTSYAYTDSSFPALNTSKTDPLGAITYFNYDSDGRLIKTQLPGSIMSYGYDPLGRLCARASGIQDIQCQQNIGLEGSTLYSYNGLSGLVSSTENVAYPISAASSGQNYTCGTANGHVACWGINGNGQLGNGNTQSTGYPVQVTGLTGAVEVSAGSDFGCALTRTSDIHCWGDDTVGQAWNGSLAGAIQVSAGNDSACAVLTDGGVECWGNNQAGQLGGNTTVSSATPAAVVGVASAVQVSVGADTACAVMSVGTIECWGSNYGDLGNGTSSAYSSTPVQVSNVTNATQVSVGDGDVCALLATGFVECWGNNYSGQLGNDSTYPSYTPVKVSGITGASSLSLGNGFACAVVSGGAVECWGYDMDGQLGNGGKTNYIDYPTVVAGLSNAFQVSAGGTTHACASLTTGGVECWGDNTYGQLGTGTTTSSSIPVLASAAASLVVPQTQSNTYAAGQLMSSTDLNGTITSYLYNTAGDVVCIAYPVSTNSTCGSLTNPGTPSATNTIVTKGYDDAGRLTSVSDWLGNTVIYGYSDPWNPTQPTSITYPSSTGVVATYGYDNNGNLVSLSAGSSLSELWARDGNQRILTQTINGSTTNGATYNANNQLTEAASPVTPTSSDNYSLAPDGSITADTNATGATTSYGYDAAGEVCWSANVVASTANCYTSPKGATSLTKYTFTSNGQRSSAVTSSGVTASTSNYSWNGFGQLSFAGTSTSVSGVSQFATGVAYTYDPTGLRLSAMTTGPMSTTTNSTWDQISGGSVPLNINDATKSLNSSGTSNTSYLYGDLLFGGTAPIEQITTTLSGSSADFLVTNPSGVQAVVSSSGVELESALYSTYGIRAITAGLVVTPFGFQGSYTDSTGLLYLINRYYDPGTDQFLSVDPAVAQTNQAFVFVNDNPLNATDPLGLKTGIRTFYVNGFEIVVRVSVSGQVSVPRSGIVVGTDGVTFKAGGLSESLSVGGVAVSLAGVTTSFPGEMLTFAASKSFSIPGTNAEVVANANVFVTLKSHSPQGGVNGRALVGAAAVTGAKLFSGAFGRSLKEATRILVCRLEPEFC